jgi:Holliday junction resolvase RusA-like endonuclease
MRLCTIELAGQPRGKANHTTRGGISYLSGATRDYLAKLAYAGQQAMYPLSPSLMPIRLHVVVAFELPRSWSKKKRAAALGGELRPTVKPDWDNSGKMIGDALNGIVWADDRQIVEAVVSKVYAERPGLSIEVETITAVHNPVDHGDKPNDLQTPLDTRLT